MRPLLFFFSLCWCIHTIHASYSTMPLANMHISSGTKRLQHMFHTPIHTGYRRIKDDGRKLLQKADCEWNNNTKACMPSEMETLSITSRSGNPVARFFTTVYSCIIPKNKEACDEVGHCFWNKVDEECVYVDWSLLHKNSPCLQNAPAFANLTVAEAKCSAESSESGCNATTNCLWDIEEGICKADHFLVFYGASGSEFNEAVNELLPLMVDDALGIFEQRYNASKPDFDWEPVLELNVSVMECPEDLHPTICTYIQEITRAVIPPAVYCFGKYGFDSEKACSANPLCEADDNFGCKMSDVVARKTGRELMLDLDFVSEHPMDRAVFKTMLSCAAHENKTDCSGIEECVWNPVEAICVTRSTMYEMLVNASNDKSDELCAGLAFYAGNDCGNHFEKGDCTANAECQFIDGECERTVTESVAAVLADDPKLHKRWDTKAKKCRKRKAQNRCDG